MIPRWIHFCWPGDDPIPEVWLDYKARWEALHPSWPVRVWREPDDSTISKAFARQANYAARSDILRAWVLWQVGGLYVDWDLEPLAAVDDLLTGDMVIATASNQPLNAFWASIPKHPALGRLLERFARLEAVELASYAVINATGSLALKATFKGDPTITYLDQVVVACPVDKRTAQTRALHHSTCRWRRPLPRLPLGDYAKRAIDAVTLGRAKTCRGCGERQDALNKLGDQIVKTVIGPRR
jgi:mannosyltransferase OCH1-like enzyme